ncbi:MAG TPA: hypothetical protein VK488_01685 [Gaiellaceae bacterium]|nr:hypothetical protein [Gaiellaceae bacterium]
MSGKAGKYARFEFERRFLVEHLPERLVPDSGWRITDRYTIDTRLRLRRMQPLAGGESVFKLGQKESPAAPDFSRMTITNIYLSAAEYEVFAVLPARELQKRRCHLEQDGRVYSLNVFDGQLAGLILAGLDFETDDELREYRQLPDWALQDVSDDERFTGGALASLTADDAATLLAQI